MRKSVNTFDSLFKFPNKPLGKLSLIRFCLRKVNGQFSLLAISTIFAACITFFVPRAISVIFDEVKDQSISPEIHLYCLVLLFLFLSVFFSKVLRDITFSSIEQKFDRVIQQAIWHRILHVPSNFFLEYSTGDLIERLSSPQKFRISLSRFFLGGLLSAGVATATFASLISIDAYLSSIILMFLVVLLFLTFFCVRIQIPILRAMNNEMGHASNFCIEIFASILVLKSLGAEKSVLQKWKSINDRVLKLYHRKRLIEITLSTYTTAYPIAGLSVIIWYFSSNDELVDASDLATFAISFSLFASAFSNAALVTFRSADLLVSYERIAPLLDELPDILDTRISEAKNLTTITFVNVTLDNPYQSEPILEKCNFSIEKGTCVAISGVVGSGKTSILRLILGLETPSNGQILVNDQPANPHDFQWLRNNCSYVAQNETLLPGTIRENVVGKGTMKKDQEIWSALDRVGLGEEFRDLPMGLDTVSTGSRTGFSTGQIQRLLVARALLSSATILIFDEAINCLDHANRKLIVNELTTENRTIIFASRHSEFLSFFDKSIMLHEPL